ncbi:MAG: hypothetical protein RLZZ338_668 [Cyanobacteriota bacterium]|jgi:hypothetical protein
MSQFPNQPPNPLNGKSSSPHPLANVNLPNIDPRLLESDNNGSPKYDSNTMEVVKKVYITLIVIGLVIGGFLSIGVLAVMKHFGLLGVPPAQVQQQTK